VTGRLLAAALAAALLTPGAEAAGKPIGVATLLTPAAVQFGDPVTAEVDVRYDPRIVDGRSIRIAPGFLPYVVVSKPQVRSASGSLRIRYSLLCVTEGCLPTHGPRRLRFAPVAVTGLVAGRHVAVTAPWRPLTVTTRLKTSDLAGQPRFRSPAAPPPPRYRLGPGPLAVGSIVTAALCVLGAAAIVAFAFSRRRRRMSMRARPPLEVAIAYVRDSTRRSGPDRRRALELLAEAADGERERELALAAADAAWSRLPPTPAGAGELADRAEQAGSPS